MGVALGERCVDEEEPEGKGEGDDRDNPTVVELVEPFDAPVEEPGVVAPAPPKSSCELDRRDEGWLL